MYNPDEECRAIIHRLKVICKIKGIKPNELARKAGIASSTMSYILNGKTQPQIYTLLQICNALEINVEELFSNAEYNNRTTNISLGVLQKIQLSNDEAKLLDHYRYFSGKKKELLGIYVDMLRQYREVECGEELIE